VFKDPPGEITIIDLLQMSDAEFDAWTTENPQAVKRLLED
jgi:hypothetical protein